ncbi:MAG: glycosyltransferase family 39 protein [Planctomycetes bacterium]|nr:glycosyltransferase family 39 protein [Planctomycetota bacterium]
MAMPHRDACLAPPGVTGAGRPARRWFVGVALVLAVATLLRLWSLDHGLPHSYYADEGHMVHRALAFGTWDLNPHWFHKPAFFMYVLFFEYGLYYALGKLAGAWSSTADFARQYFTDPTWFYVLGRATATLAGLGVVALTLACGRRIGGTACGLIAGLVVATNYCMAEAGRWVKADMPCALFTLVATWALVRVAEEGRRRHYWLAGLAIGVGTAVKYYTFALVPTVWLVHWIRRPPAGTHMRRVLDGRPWQAMLAVLVAFFVLSPYNVLDFGTWWRLNLGPRFEEILTQKLGATFLALGTAGHPPLLDGLRSFARCYVRPDCMGLVWGTLGVAGLAWQLGQRARPARVGLLAVLPFVAIAVLWNPIDFEPRYFTPVIPLFALAAGQLLGDLWTVVRRARPRLAVWSGLVALGAMGLPGVLDIVAWNQRHARQDTRSIAAAWVEAHVPPGTALLNDHDWVPLRKNTAALELEWGILKAHRARGRGGPFLGEAKDHQYEHAIAASRAAAAAGRPTYKVFTLHHPWWSREEDPEGDLGRHEWDLDMGTPWPRRPLAEGEIRSLGIRYIVTTAKTYADYQPGGRSAHFQTWAAFYRWLERQPLVYTIPYQPDVRPGPTVRIHAVTP